MPPERTPCPACGAAIRVKGERGACAACGQRVRFVDAPEAPCPVCGAQVPLAGGRGAGRCRDCGTWTADEPTRRVEARATCPRCRRRIEVPLDDAHTVCPHCRTGLALQDTV